MKKTVPLTEEEIAAGNIIIGEFMGFTTYYMEAVNQLMINVKSDVPVYLSNWARTAFHEDWNWLMPVAKKCIDSYYDGRSNIYAGLNQVDIVALYRACVAFIQWLPGQPPKSEVWPNSK